MHVGVAALRARPEAAGEGGWHGLRARGAAEDLCAVARAEDEARAQRVVRVGCAVAGELERKPLLLAHARSLRLGGSSRLLRRGEHERGDRAEVDGAGVCEALPRHKHEHAREVTLREPEARNEILLRVVHQPERHRAALRGGHLPPQRGDLRLLGEEHRLHGGAGVQEEGVSGEHVKDCHVRVLLALRHRGRLFRLLGLVESARRREQRRPATGGASSQCGAGAARSRAGGRDACAPAGRIFGPVDEELLLGFIRPHRFPPVCTHLEGALLHWRGLQSV